jgi:hypothetical protein
MLLLFLPLSLLQLLPFGDKMKKEKLEEKKGDFISSVINLDVLKNESLSIFKEGEI